MGRALAMAVGLLGSLVGMTVQAADLGTLKIGVLQFGTVSWELDVIEQHGLDAKEGFDLEVMSFAGNEAADVALMGEAVDGIVEDWLWVSRQRAEGVPLTFIPYSSSVGALMVPADGSIQSLADLEGKRIGIAGGPLDKSWLLIQAVAKERDGVDLAEIAEPVYGAPPLLTEKFRSGELDAVINYWHYAARLEAEGHRRLLDVTAAQEGLGVPADTPQLGYVFREPWADEHAELIQAFARASRAAKAIMDESDEEWQRLRAADPGRERRDPRRPDAPLPRGHRAPLGRRRARGRRVALCRAGRTRRRGAGRQLAGAGRWHILVRCPLLERPGTTPRRSRRRAAARLRRPGEAGRASCCRPCRSFCCSRSGRSPRPRRPTRGSCRRRSPCSACWRTRWSRATCSIISA